jgi:hypothetical protein
MVSLLEQLKVFFIKKAWADDVNIGGESVTVDYPVITGWDKIEDIFTETENLIQFLIGFSAVVCVAMIIVGGYTMITSSGNPDKIEQGQKTLTGAVIGLIICFIAWLIVIFVLKDVLGIE